LWFGSHSWRDRDGLKSETLDTPTGGDDPRCVIVIRAGVVGDAQYLDVRRKKRGVLGGCGSDRAQEELFGMRPLEIDD
jgi:hypothetical protein